MNSRILKKLCKRAEQHPTLFEGLERVIDGSNDPICSSKFDRKHLLRSRYRDGFNYVKQFDNTPCYGGESGYYEPEWSDSAAYYLLVEQYVAEHTEYFEDRSEYVGIKFSKLTPSKVFQHFGL